MNNKVVIIGCGNVGMSYAYALLNQKTFVNELVLIDLDQRRIEGEVMDLNHGMAFSPSKIKIKTGNYAECHDAKIICICAGANQEIGETRMDLISKNSKIFKTIVDEVIKTGFKGIFLVATNPVDVMTYLTWKYSKLPPSNIIGSGTTLDTARLRYIIGDKLNINPKNIHAYVMGEHGDSEFVPWSTASVGLEAINCFLNKAELDDICENVKKAAYEIIERKKATYYGIGMCLVRITNAILGDESTILTVSSFDKTNDVFIGGPTIINRSGVEKRIYLNLDQSEIEKLTSSITIVKNAIKKINI